MSKKCFLTVAVLVIVLAFALVMPHPANAANQKVTLQVEGMT